MTEITHRAFPKSDSAWQPHWEELPKMDAQEELKAHLMATNDQFRSLAEQHAQLKKKLETIESKPRLTLADEEEEHQIKKLKLRLKDQMNEMLVQHRAQPVH